MSLLASQYGGDEAANINRSLLEGYLIPEKQMG